MPKVPDASWSRAFTPTRTDGYPAGGLEPCEAMVIYTSPGIVGGGYGAEVNASIYSYTATPPDEAVAALIQAVSSYHNATYTLDGVTEPNAETPVGFVAPNFERIFLYTRRGTPLKFSLYSGSTISIQWYRSV